MATETVKAKYNKQIIEGKILYSRRTRTIETEDNPDPINVLLHRIKSKVPFKMLMWDDTEKLVTEAWVDDLSIIRGV